MELEKWIFVSPRDFRDGVRQLALETLVALYLSDGSMP